MNRMACCLLYITPKKIHWKGGVAEDVNRKTRDDPDDDDDDDDDDIDVEVNPFVPEPKYKSSDIEILTKTQESTRI